MRAAITVQSEEGRCRQVALVEPEFAEATADAIAVQLHDQGVSFGCVVADTDYGEYVVDAADVFEWRDSLLLDRIGTAIHTGEV